MLPSRVDLSELHSWRSRKAFVENIARGDAGIELARASLQIAAEDDAIVSHSTVDLPIQSFLSRLESLVTSLSRRPQLSQARTPEEQLQVIRRFLFWLRALWLAS